MKSTKFFIKKWVEFSKNVFCFSMIYLIWEKFFVLFVFSILSLSAENFGYVIFFFENLSKLLQIIFKFFGDDF